MATHSSILSWRIPWTEKPGRLQSIRSHRIGQWLTCYHVPGILHKSQNMKMNKAFFCLFFFCPWGNAETGNNNGVIRKYCGTFWMLEFWWKELWMVSNGHRQRISIVPGLLGDWEWNWMIRGGEILNDLKQEVAGYSDMIHSYHSREQEVIWRIYRNESQSLSPDQHLRHPSELVRNANYAPPHSCRIRISGGGSDCNLCCGWRVTSFRG